MSKLFLTLFLSLSCAMLSAGKWDHEYWQSAQVQQWHKGAYKLYANTEIRLNQGCSTFYFFRCGENFVKAVRPWLDCEFHINYIHHKPLSATQFMKIYRFDWEINPTLRLSSSAQLSSRNRLELLKREEIATWKFIFRERLTLAIETSSKILCNFRMWDELFYDFELQKFTQNRFVPCEISFSFKKMTLDLFVMARHFYSSGFQSWFKSLVIGCELKF